MWLCILVSCSTVQGRTNTLHSITHRTLGHALGLSNLHARRVATGSPFAQSRSKISNVARARTSLFHSTYSCIAHTVISVTQNSYHNCNCPDSTKTKSKIEVAGNEMNRAKVLSPIGDLAIYVTAGNSHELAEAPYLSILGAPRIVDRVVLCCSEMMVVLIWERQSGAFRRAMLGQRLFQKGLYTAARNLVPFSQKYPESPLGIIHIPQRIARGLCTSSRRNAGLGPRALGSEHSTPLSSLALEWQCGF